MVVCRCGFKTFNPVSLKSEGVTVTSCQVLPNRRKVGLDHPHRMTGVEEFEVAISGGVWVAIRVYSLCLEMQQKKLWNGDGFQ
jgi:hypothetical protein